MKATELFGPVWRGARKARLLAIDNKRWKKDPFLHPFSSAKRHPLAGVQISQSTLLNLNGLISFFDPLQKLASTIPVGQLLTIVVSTVWGHNRMLRSQWLERLIRGTVAQL